MKIAIYSRKSKWTGRGESVENQVIMCREYITQWIEGARDAEIVVYEDEGFSGKDTNRPRFQDMMAELKEEHYDYLVCYKLDRLGRNIADLALLIDELNKRETHFISIKEKFDTSTPIGKAMLYFSGVLAQMEREQIAERVRDNMVMLARTGRWLGGNTPLGFTSGEERKVTIEGRSRKSYRLVPREEEIRLVRLMFQLYLEKHSLTKVVEYLLNYDITSRNDKEYTITTVRDILVNPVYCTADPAAYDYFWSLGCQVCFEREEASGRVGLIGYGKTVSGPYKAKDNPPEKWIIALGKHAGVISGTDFVKVQKLLQCNKKGGAHFSRVQNEVSLLSGLLFCSCGHAMRPKYYSANQVNKHGTRRFSYLCPYKARTHGEKCSCSNLQGNTLDKMVCEEVLRYTEDNMDLRTLLFAVEQQIGEVQMETVSEETVLKNQIKNKQEEISRLISALGKSNESPEFVRKIEEKIEKLNIDCTNLKAKSEANKEEDKMQGVAQKLPHLIDQITSFRSLFLTLTVLEQREYLKLVLDRILWDGERVHIYFKDGCSI